MIRSLLALLLGATVLVVCLAAPREAPAAAEKTGFLIKDGIASGALYLPMTGVDASLRFAAQELQDHLEAITGTRLTVAYREPRDDQGGVVLAVLPKAQWQAGVSEQFFTIRQDSRRTRVEITGNTSLAVLYGVYQYLESLGVRWYSPGALGTHLPRSADIAIQPGLQAREPSFASRSMALSSTVQNNFGGAGGDKDFEDYQLFLMRNRTQLDRFAASRGNFAFNIERSTGGHAIKPMSGLTSQQVRQGLMQKSPERFALVTREGEQKRRYDDGQICFTNEVNIETATKNAIAFFDELDSTRTQRGSDLDDQATAPMGLSDTTGMCECEQCAKVAGDGPNKADRLAWHFWNRVARGLNEKRPGRKIAVYSPYLELSHPPAGVRVEPNVMVVTALVNAWEIEARAKETYPFPPRFLDQVKQTRDAGCQAFSSYNYLFFPWSPTPLLVLDQLQGYSRLGHRHYHMEAMQRSEYTWPLIWSIAQFTWDNSREPRDYLREYCLNYYGESAGQIVLKLLEDLTANALSLDRLTFGGAADTAYMLPDALITAARRDLRAALATADGRQKQRLQRFNDAIEAQFQLAEVYRAFTQAINTRADADIDALHKKANRLITFWGERNLVEISNRYRTPEVAARQFLQVKVKDLKPIASKAMLNAKPGDAVWMSQLFAGATVPQQVDHLHPLPEVWKLHMDATRSGSAEAFSNPAFDDSADWQPISTWNYISTQGYCDQLAGYFWYRLVFDAPAFPAGRRIMLRVGSLDDSGDVYLNGKLVGRQPDPHAWDRSFAVDVTEHLKPGQPNVLVIHGFDSGGAEGVWRPCALYAQ